MMMNWCSFIDCNQWTTLMGALVMGGLCVGGDAAHPRPLLGATWRGGYSNPLLPLNLEGWEPQNIP